MKLHGMWHNYKTLLDTNHDQDLTDDELVNILVQSEWEQRQSKRFNRHLRQTRLRYTASMEEVDFTAHRGLEKNLFVRLADYTPTFYFNTTQNNFRICLGPTFGF